MKANEAPEKIYIQRFDVNEEEAKFDKSKMFFDDIWVEEPESSHDYIEYTHTDAFIEKACEFWRDHLDGYDICEDDIERSVESFKLAMKL